MLTLPTFLFGQTLTTFPNIPGRTPSDNYVCRVRQVGSNVWNDAFVLQTVSIPKVTYPDGTHNGYLTNLTNWTASWIAFEFSGTSVEVEFLRVQAQQLSNIQKLYC